MKKVFFIILSIFIGAGSFLSCSNLSLADQQNLQEEPQISASEENEIDISQKEETEVVESPVEILPQETKTYVSLQLYKDDVLCNTKEYELYSRVKCSDFILEKESGTSFAGYFFDEAKEYPVIHDFIITKDTQIYSVFTDTREGDLVLSDGTYVSQDYVSLETVSHKNSKPFIKPFDSEVAGIIIRYNNTDLTNLCVGINCIKDFWISGRVKDKDFAAKAEELSYASYNDDKNKPSGNKYSFDGTLSESLKDGKYFLKNYMSTDIYDGSLIWQNLKLIENFPADVTFTAHCFAENYADTYIGTQSIYNDWYIPTAFEALFVLVTVSDVYEKLFKLDILSNTFFMESTVNSGAIWTSSMNQYPSQDGSIRINFLKYILKKSNYTYILSSAEIKACESGYISSLNYNYKAYAVHIIE